MDPSKKSPSTPPAITSIKPEPTTSSSFLGLNLNNVKTPKPILRHESSKVREMERSMQEECIFTENNFLVQLHKYHSFDIITYTIMPFGLFRLRPIRRLIYGVGNPPMGTKSSIQVSHSHAKLWLCYKYENDPTPDVFMGSANATDMTILDLMVRVNSRQAKTLIGYFNLLWNINHKAP